MRVEQVAKVLLPELTEERSEGAKRRDPVTIGHVEVTVTVVAASTVISLGEVLGIRPGVIIPFEHPPEAPVEVRANGHLLARADIVVLEEEISARISEIVSGMPT